LEVVFVLLEFSSPSRRIFIGSHSLPPPSGSPYWSFTLPLALAVGHVDSWSPEDEEDVLHRREATGVSVTTILLSLALLRGGAALVLLEHVALLEGVVDRCLVVWAGLL
jgi:hypothetical protein